MRLNFLLLLSVVLISLALGSCGENTASSDDAVQRKSVPSVFPVSAAPATGLPDDDGSVANDKCLTCHAADRNVLVAPSFSSIAQRYANSGNAATILATSIATGSHGKWTGAHDDVMPSQPQLSEKEKKALIEWILKQKPALGKE